MPLRSAANSTIPEVTVIDDREIMKTAMALLRKATMVKIQMSKLEEQERQIKDELNAICTAYNLPGLRHGLNCIQYDGWQTRKTLSKEMLLANGVTAEQIANSFAESKPFQMAKIVPFDIE